MPAFHQVVDTRRGGASVIHFPNAEAENAYNERIRAFRASIPRDVRFVVAPDQRVLGRDGKWRESGTPIAEADVGDEPGAPDKGRVAWQVFESLLDEGMIIENYEYKPPVDAAR